MNKNLGIYPHDAQSTHDRKLYDKDEDSWPIVYRWNKNQEYQELKKYESKRNKSHNCIDGKALNCLQANLSI